jgi:hypothetical protein
MNNVEKSFLNLKNNIFNSSSISRGSYSEVKNKGNLRPEVIEKLLLFGFNIDQILTTHKIYKFMEVEEACNLMIRDPDTNLYNHEFITDEANLYQNENYKNKNKDQILKSNLKSMDFVKNLGIDSSNFLCKICYEKYSEHSNYELNKNKLQYHISIAKNKNNAYGKDNEINETNFFKKFSLPNLNNQKRRISHKPVFQNIKYKKLFNKIKEKPENDESNNKELKISIDTISNNSNSRIFRNTFNNFDHSGDIKTDLYTHEIKNNLVLNEKKPCTIEIDKKNLKIKKNFIVPNEIIELFTNPDICKICCNHKITEKNKAIFSCGHFFCCTCVTNYLTINILDGKVNKLKI